MTRLLALAPVAIAFVTATADAQVARPGVPIAIAADRGERDGRAAAAITPIGGYAVLGVLTGFVAGVVGPIVWAHNNSAVAGAVTLVPFIWTLAAAARTSRAAPTPDVIARIQTEPATYQEAFRVSYAQRLAQRRKRATIIGGVAGTLAGFAAFVALAIAALSTEGT